MNSYDLLAARVDTPEAQSLAERLTAWHDATVMHRRRAYLARSADPCSADCPCQKASYYWSEARRVFGVVAADLTFLRALADPGTDGSAGAQSDERRRAGTG